MTTIDTGTPELLATAKDGVLTLTLNRPDARNALTPAMFVALDAQLAHAETDTAIRCIVLAGAGKGFCSGGDVKSMAATDSDAEPLSIDAFIHAQRIAQHGTAGRLFKMPKPTIAAINGAAAGAGLSLALACDLRVMSTAAVLTTAFAKVGLSGDFGGTYYMTQLVGTAKARELYYLSDRVDAAEALRLGLVTAVAEPDAFAQVTAALAGRLASGPGVAYRYMKENLNRALVAGHDDCLDIEATHHVHCFSTADNQAAVQAFMEKRDPVFTGR